MGMRERLMDRLLGPAPAPPAPAPPAPRTDAAPPQPGVRIDSIANALTGLGGASDKGAVARPYYRQPLTPHELGVLYEQNGIAGRIVDSLPDDACRKGWHATGLDEVEAIEAEERDLRIAASVCHAMKMARLYGGALVVPITNGDPAQPLDLGKVTQIDAVHVFDEDDACPVSWDADIHSRGYREPRLWQVTGPDRTLRVHASRCFWVRGRRRSNRRLNEYAGNWPDKSELQHVYDALQRLESVSQAGAVIAQELRTSVLRVGGTERLEASQAAETLTARALTIAKMKSVLGVLLLGKEDEFTSHANPPTGFQELSQEGKAMLCAVTDMPATRLFGEAPGGLNTDGVSGWQHWDRKVVAYQDRHTPLLTWLWSLMLAASGRAADVEGGEWSMQWRALSEPSFKERVDAYKETAAADAVYLDRGVLSVEAVQQARFGEGGWELEAEMSEETVDDLEAEARAALAEAGGVEETEEAEGAEGDPLNGAQIQSLLSVLERVRSGALTTEMARVILSEFLGGNPVAVDKLLADATKVAPPDDDAMPTKPPGAAEEE